MKRFSMPLGLALAALTFLANAAAAHAEERPIKAMANGGLYLFGNSPRLVGDGLASHLGQSVVVVTLDEYEFAEGNLVPVGLVIYGAANALFASVHGSFDPETGVLTGTITIVGGSRGFADATGSADLLIMFDDSFNFCLALDGTIDY